MKQKTDWFEVEECQGLKHWISICHAPKGFFGMSADVRWLNVWGRGISNKTPSSSRKIIGDPD